MDLHKTESCLCGRSYDQPGALKLHQRLCSKSKKRLSQALEKARELWPKRKRRRVEDLTECGGSSQPLLGVVTGSEGASPTRSMDIPSASQVCLKLLLLSLLNILCRPESNRD
jgi:hypothetical protein